jgi:ParB family chromosome partitioning protein
MTAAVSAVLRIPVELLDHGPNARGDLGDVDELALSMKVLGQQVPILVYPPGHGGRYVVHDGNRRLKAARQAGLAFLQAVVRQHPGGAAVVLQQQLAIQGHARAFDPIAEARALHELMFVHGMSREEISRAVGRTPGWVRDRIGLLQLTAAEQSQVTRGVIPLGEALLRVRARRDERDGRRAAPASTAPSAPPARPLPTVRDGGAVVLHCRTCTCGGS